MWEVIEWSPLSHTERMGVPGGWVVRTSVTLIHSSDGPRSIAVALVFVPRVAGFEWKLPAEEESEEA